MMKMTGKAFAKKLFGAKYERLPRTIFMDVIVFWGLYIAGFQVQIASFVRVLMISAFTAGVMWQALSSKDNAAELQHMLMLPHRCRELVFSYVAVLGVVTAILLLGSRTWFCLLLLVNSLFAILILWRADGYAFYRWVSKKHPPGIPLCQGLPQRKRASLLRYFFRYLICHKNYLLNTAVMWCVALVLPYFFSEMAGLSVIPVGFAILSLNTPICILLSCDPDLEQAVRFLPGQKGCFCIPYCLFIFLCNMAADIIFLLSWQIQNGSVTAQMIAGAVFFALQSAVLSVLLEWFYPIRGWKIESDLWHHPRKYVVPVVMLLLAGAVSSCPVLLPVLLALLAVEVTVLWK